MKGSVAPRKASSVSTMQYEDMPPVYESPKCWVRKRCLSTCQEEEAGGWVRASARGEGRGEGAKCCTHQRERAQGGSASALVGQQRLREDETGHG